MIKTIKIQFSIEYNRYDIQLIGAMTHPMKGTIDYLQKSIQDASRIFDITFYDSEFNGITEGHTFVFDAINIPAYQAWAKVLFANSIQDQVMRGILSMPLAKTYIKLEYPELVTVVSDVGPGFKYMSEIMRYIPKDPLALHGATTEEFGNSVNTMIDNMVNKTIEKEKENGSDHDRSV